jgi:hypothetical protein
MGLGSHAECHDSLHTRRRGGENAFLLDEADGLLRRKLLSSLTGDV